MTSKDLFNTLDDLGDKEFKIFKWFLQQPDILKGYQPIKVSKLENAERQDTVTLMLSTFKPHGALTVTKKVLKEMNRNDLVESLSDASSDQKMDVPVPEPRHISYYQDLLKSHLKNKFMCAQEGWAEKKDEQRLDDIYTELYITAGGDVHINKQHEVMQIEECVDMAAASNLLSEDQFLCSICLDVFTDPVTTPCGHNFCKKCINDYWNTSDRCQCPMCKEVFTSRPDWRVNTLFSEMVSQFRQAAQQKASSSSSEQQESKPGEVPCDVCTGTKLKALKSCLVCLASYCETHLEPHLTMSGLKRHQLIDPVENLEGRMCTKHDKPLELFCRTDQTCVCMLCTVLDHKMHDVVPLKEECEGKKVQLEKTEAEIQEMIQKRRLKIQEVKHMVELSEEDADREKAEGVQVFTDLKESVERKLNELIKTIEEKQRATKKQAEDSIKELEQELSELMKRSTEVEKLSLSEDHLHLLQGVQSLNIHLPPPTKDWTKVSVPPASYEGTVRRAVSQLEETLSEKRKKLVDEDELKRVQKFAVDVTLDPDTAHPKLIMSGDGKQVNHGDVRKNLPNNPERFSSCVSVLSKQSFSSGRFYFEVQVKGKTEWTLGVTRELSNRKGQLTLSPQKGYWTIWLRNENEYKANDDPPVLLSLKSRPQKVGVFVDYEEGLVSFYDVEAAALIYSFTGCSFKEKLFPYFSPSLNDGGKNSAPLIITPVRVN